MELKIDKITFIIVCFKSEKVIYDCLNSLPINSKKIIIENSNNIKLKKNLELKYDNIEVILNNNQGMGSSNNIGIAKAITDYVYVLNPDTKFQKDTLDNLVLGAKSINDFAIISPLNSNPKYPNYKILKQQINEDENIISVDTIDGFSMLINIKKFKNKKLFDENIFLYLENDDLCMSAKKAGHEIFIVKNSFIDHIGSSSSNFNNNNEFDYLRNWHWMWSKFYFNKKHHGYFNAILKTFLNFISATIKYLFYSLILNNHKSKIYKMRVCGLFSSMMGKESNFRLKD